MLCQHGWSLLQADGILLHLPGNIVTGLKEPFDLIFKTSNGRRKPCGRLMIVLEERIVERTTELRASEEKYRSLIQKIPAAVIVHGPQTEIITAIPLHKLCLV